MDQKYINKNKFSEQYIITDMIIFTISACMILLLMLNSLRIYSDSKFITLNYLSEQANKIDQKLSNKVTKSIIKMDWYEEKILNILQNNQKTNNFLTSTNIRKEIKKIFRKTQFSFVPIEKNIEMNKISLFNKTLQNKNYYYIMINNNFLLCKDLYFNKKLLGTITLNPMPSGFETKINENINELSIIDSKNNIYQIIEKKIKNNKKFQLFKNNENSNLSLNAITGDNLVYQKSYKLNLTIRLQINPAFIKNKIFISIISQLLEILGFSFFFLLLMALIIRKDKIRNDYAEKLKEEAISANKAKSDFLAYTAHEIRSPLGFILTGTEMIQNGLLGDVSDKCKEYIEGINSNAKSILNFIIEILDENKILQNKVYLNKDFHDVTEIILDVIKHNKTKFYSKKAEFITDFQPNLPLLHCDEKKIYQILNNIITNSYKYCKDEIIITVRVFLEKQKLFIIIEDNGIGMTSDEMKLAMKRYESINISTNSDSYGLGLSIVKLLIDAHDARLYVDSTKNIGTVITITFKQKFLKL